MAEYVRSRATAVPPVNVHMASVELIVNQLSVSMIGFIWIERWMSSSRLALRLNTDGSSCSRLNCENGGTCQERSFNAICSCKPGFTGQRCETGRMTSRPRRSIQRLLCLEYFRCRGNGRFADVSHCKQGRYFECVYFGQCQCATSCEIFCLTSVSLDLDDLNLPNGILFSRTCPTGLWFSALNDRCDYPSAVQC